MSSYNFSEKTSVLILGARSDIGKALAHRFAKQGCQILMAARNAASLEADVTDLKVRYQVKASSIEFDVRNFDSHPGFLKALPVQPDLVICLVGYLGDQEVAQANWDEAHRIIETNFTGPASILGLIADVMEKKTQGCIIGVSSVAGDRGRQSNYLYGSAKAGLSAFLSGLRNRLSKSGVHVMTVKPGFVNTAMTAGMDLPGVLTAEPDQVAESIYSACTKGKNSIYTLWFWRWIMLIIRSVPESIFKKLSL